MGKAGRLTAPLTWYVVALVALVVVGIGFGLVVDSIHSLPPSAIQRSLEVLPPASERVRSYTVSRTVLYWVALIWHFAGLCLAVRWGIAHRTLQTLRCTRASSFRSAMAVWAGLVVYLAVWRLPVGVISTLIERAYGLSTITAGLWLSDRMRDVALDLAWAPGVAVAWGLMRRYPANWWLLLGALLAPVGALLTVVYPVFIDPLYNRFRLLEQEPLRHRILQLAERAGVHDPAVLVADHSKRTRKANAYVTGIGPTHRIVIWDTTLRRMTDDETLAITAHELGHYRLGHIWTGLALYTLGGFGTLWALALGLRTVMAKHPQAAPANVMHDASVIPVAYLILSLLLLAQTPLASAVSRMMERQADSFSLRVFRNGEATARALASFSKDDLANPDPNPLMVAWSHSHPPLRERVARALMTDQRDPRR